MRKNKAGSVHNGFTMMALDDDATITSALKAYFEASGYQVDTEIDPIQALTRMQEKRYDVLLLDFLMQPICGDEFVTRLRSFDRDVFIILLTGHRELAPPLNTLRDLDIQGYYEKSERFDQLELLVESCVKAIKQMRIIRNYRDGLSRILTAATQIHRLAPLRDIMARALQQAELLVRTEGLFLWIEPERVVGSATDEALDLTKGMFMGGARYDIAPDVFHENVLPGLSSLISQAIQTAGTCNSQGFLVVPLQHFDGRPFGVLVVDVLSSVNSDLTQLLEMFARQTAAALSNALLHEAVEVKNKEVTHAYQRLNASYMDTISALRMTVDAKDIYTRGHSDRVSHYAFRLAGAIGLDEARRETVRVAGLFHDVGKVGISDKTLTKNGPLTDEEFDEIRKHPQMSGRILSAVAMFKDLPHIVSAHHERYDGRGYPDGLAGEAIPLEARIIAIADAFDAMTSDRHYRRSLGAERAMEEIRKGSGFQFDPVLADAFLALLENSAESMCDELAWTYGEKGGEAV